jgi:hypothetical protein
MAHDPPWRLDPLKNIVNVGWGKQDILVLQIDQTLGIVHAPDLISFESLGFTSSVVDAFQSQIKEPDTFVPVPDIVDPVSKEMMSHLFMWSKPVYKLNTSDGYTWRALVFLNIGKIRGALPAIVPARTSWEFTLQFPASRRVTTADTLYWIWQNNFYANFFDAKEHPFTTGVVIDAEGHVAVLSIPFIPSPNSAARRDEILGYNAGSLPPFLSFDEAISDDVSDNLRYTVTARTYRSLKKFPASATNLPSWDQGLALAEAHITRATQPALTLTVNVRFKDLLLTFTPAA